MKILIVDDFTMNLKVAENMINSIRSRFVEDFSLISDIFTCADSLSVVDTIAEKEIDILFLDIVMPNKDGFDLLDEIRSIPKYKAIQIIMLTATDSPEIFEKCFDMGANDFLSKPIQEYELKARLKAAIKNRKHIQELSELYAQSTMQYEKLQETTNLLREAQFHMIQKEKLASIGELAAGLAHEINNPLGFVASNIETMGKFCERIDKAMKGYKKFVDDIKVTPKMMIELEDNLVDLEVLNVQNKTEKIIEELGYALADSMDGVNRITKIVKTLRNFARTGLDEEREYVNINQIIEEILLIIKNESKYIAEIESLFDELPHVLCNRGQIGQVILNILINAVQAIKAQKRESLGRIIICTQLKKDKVLIKIIDDGPGIPEEFINKIFNPFFTSKEVGTGTGLGLSISHDIIVDKHHGELVAGNNLKQGAFFEILLPISWQEVDSIE